MMKTLLMVLSIALASRFLHAQGKLIVTVEGIDERKGSVLVGLFSDKDTFLKDPTYGQVVPLEGRGEVRAVFNDLKPGEYAISIVHDVNGNGKLDTNGLGIPREGFGFGNNAMGLFGPPSFSKAKVSIGKEPVHQALRMKYMF
jgi:uncharacterized protein (DUF2141 family)